MLVNQGEAILKQFAESEFVPDVTKAADRVYYVSNYGSSNAVFIVAEHSVILVDVLDSDERAKRLRQIIAEVTDKPVKTIIFTHGHPDHRGGAAAFEDTAEEIIAHAPMKPVLGRLNQIDGILSKRGVRQHGYLLTEDEAITQGIGIREGRCVGDGKYSFLKPTTVYCEDRVECCIDGVNLVFIAAVGETDDTMLVWLPDEKALCCGDNYYGTFPNLYAIRGSQYRDVDAWVASLDQMIALRPEILLPGHTHAIFGAGQVEDVLTHYRDAIDWILNATLDGMNKEKTADELAAEIRLPEEYKSLPYLAEHYGTVQWTVRGIYAGYVGWFDGNPTSLNRLSPKEQADRTIALAGGVDKVKAAITTAVEQQDFQWAAELCDVLLHSGCEPYFAREKKAQSLLGISKLDTSATGRHYYITCAKELEDENRRQQD